MSWPRKTFAAVKITTRRDAGEADREFHNGRYRNRFMGVAEAEPIKATTGSCRMEFAAV
jgi:hypothetical protein